ncbi:Zinc cluster transcription factor [Drechslerella dactyloides]|uniref:Zinc cluster transcription factor n=1 Tax=Drechslerella dactyloides TaxID=74499 RepID=A0AAD6IXK9_DREDA|nr:Zinc cluster transcription factor [Drechslerella dactyloides]
MSSDTTMAAATAAPASTADAASAAAAGASTGAHGAANRSKLKVEEADDTTTAAAAPSSTTSDVAHRTAPATPAKGGINRKKAPPASPRTEAATKVNGTVSSGAMGKAITNGNGNGIGNGNSKKRSAESDDDGDDEDGATPAKAKTKSPLKARVKTATTAGATTNGSKAAGDERDHERDGVEGYTGQAVSSSSSPVPAPTSSSSANGSKVSKRRKVNHGHLCRDEVRDAKKLKTERDHSTEEASPSSPTSPNEMATNTPEVQDLPVEDSVDGILQRPPQQQQEQQQPQTTQQQTQQTQTQTASQTNPSMPPPRNSVAPGLLAPSPVSTTQRAKFNNNNSNNPNFLVPDWTGAGVSQQDWNPYHHPMMFSNPEAASEYDLMNEFFLDSIYNNDMFLGGGGESLFQDPSFSGPNLFGPSSASASSATENGTSAAAAAAPGGSLTANGLRANAMLPQAAPSPMIRPASVKPTLEKAKELYYLTAADPPKDGIPEDRMKQVLKAKHDAGLLKPFNYINGYRRLQKYMDENMQPPSKQRIQKSLERFRPQFRQKTHQLTDIDLIFVEEWFERSLMEYDRVFAAMAVPACLWRRTGEIFRGNKEFAELIHVPIEHMRDGKLAIYELIAEDSAVSYWEKFGAIAFDPSQKAMLTTCYLKNPDPNATDKLIHCCFSFTIRRDSSHIPAMIIGNFLPIP